MKVWECKIGVLGDTALPSGADMPMRRAICAEFKRVTGTDEEFIFSGWGGVLDENELAVVENRMPSEESQQAWRVREAAPALLCQLESAQVELDLLRRAIEEGDPKAELLIRVTDLWKRNAAAIASALGADK